MSLIACSYQIGNEPLWDNCDEESWLLPSEEAHAAAKQRILDDVAEDGGGTVRFRYEEWVDDESLELASAETVLWAVTYPDGEDGGCFDTPLEALRDIAEHGPIKVDVMRLCRTRCYGEHEMEVSASTT